MTGCQKFFYFAYIKAIKFFSIFLVALLYALIALEFYAFIVVISPLLKKRLGTELGLLWCVVGIILVFNILFNHFFAMVIRPGGPKDLRITERLRIKDKARPNRKAIIDNSMND